MFYFKNRVYRKRWSVFKPVLCKLLIQPVLSKILSLLELKFSQAHVNFVLIQKSAYVDHILKYHQLPN